MALPKLDQPQYKHFLVGLDREVIYRPFTLKEQKILLMAKESEDQQQQINAMKQIIDLCVLSDINPSELAYFDVEDIFLRIRSKSVSDVSELLYEDKKSEKQYKIKIDLDQVQVKTPEHHTRDIEVTDQLKMHMQYPTLDLFEQADADDSNEQLLRSCIDYVYDDNSVYYFSDQTQEEITEWLDNLSAPVLKRINEFFETMPRLRHEVNLTLDDGEKETLVFEGLESLFT